MFILCVCVYVCLVCMCVYYIDFDMDTHSNGGVLCAGVYIIIINY